MLRAAALVSAALAGVIRGIHHGKKVVAISGKFRFPYRFGLQLLLQIRQLQIRALIALFVRKFQNLQIRQCRYFRHEFC